MSFISSFLNLFTGSSDQALSKQPSNSNLSPASNNKSEQKKPFDKEDCREIFSIFSQKLNYFFDNQKQDKLAEELVNFGWKELENEPDVLTQIPIKEILNKMDPYQFGPLHPKRAQLIKDFQQFIQSNKQLISTMKGLREVNPDEFEKIYTVHEQEKNISQTHFYIMDYLTNGPSNIDLINEAASEEQADVLNKQIEEVGLFSSSPSNNPIFKEQEKNPSDTTCPQTLKPSNHQVGSSEEEAPLFSKYKKTTNLI